MAIASSVSDWLLNHPAVYRLLQIGLWMSNHPIIGLLSVLVLIAIAWQLIKAIGYLIEVGARSLMQAPLKLVEFLFGVSKKSLGHVSALAIKQLTGKNTTELPALPPASSQLIKPNKQQRLAEISSRLEALQQEQNELLQEVATIMAADKINVEA